MQKAVVLYIYNKIAKFGVYIFTIVDTQLWTVLVFTIKIDFE